MDLSAFGDSSALRRVGLVALLLGAGTSTALAADPDDPDGTGAVVMAPEEPAPAEAEPIIVVEEADPETLPPGVNVNVHVGSGAACTNGTCESSVDGEAQAEPERPEEPGTHFLFEVGLGASFGGGFGFAADALFGWGGRPFGMPLRFYVFAEIAHLSNEASGTIAGSLYQNHHRYLDLALGLRTYVPIYGALRLFADASIGAALNTARLEHTAIPLEEEGWYAAVGLGGGLQLRIFNGLSLGIRARVLFTDDGLSSTRTAMHIDDTIPFDLTGSVTWHF
jgi:hypothetical protein